MDLLVRSIDPTRKDQIRAPADARGPDCFLEEGANSYRWSFRRVQGSHRRLFPVTGEGPQRGGRNCQRVPDAEIWIDRRSPACGRAVSTHVTPKREETSSNFKRHMVRFRRIKKAPWPGRRRPRSPGINVKILAILKTT